MHSVTRHGGHTPCCWCSITSVGTGQGFGVPPGEPVSSWFVLGTRLFARVVLVLWSKLKTKVKPSQSAKISWLQAETKQRAHGLYGFILKS